MPLLADADPCTLFFGMWILLGIIVLAAQGVGAVLGWLVEGVWAVVSAPGRIFGRVFGVRQRLRMFALNWRHRRDQRLIESLHLMPAERDALLLDAAKRFMKEAGEIVHGG